MYLSLLLPLVPCAQCSRNHGPAKLVVAFVAVRPSVCSGALARAERQSSGARGGGSIILITLASFSQV